MRHLIAGVVLAATAGLAVAPLNADPHLVAQASSQTSIQDIHRSYEIAFGRQASSGEVAHWQAQIRQTLDQLVALHRDYIRRDSGARQHIIEKSYRDILNRPPSDAERAHWDQSLRDNGYTYAQLVDVHRRTLATATTPQDMTRSYQIAFGREPARAEVEFWQTQPGKTLDQLLALHRDHLKRDATARRDVIDRSYQNGLGRPPSDPERRHWDDQLRAHGYTYSELMEVHRKTAATATTPQDITRSYQTAFGRDPAAGELQFWQTQPAKTFDQLVTLHRDHLKRDAAARRDVIDRSYQAALRRAPNDAERRFWDDQLRASGFTYAELVSQHQKNVAAPETLPPFKFPGPVPALDAASRELKQFAQIARDVSAGVRNLNIPAATDAAGFLAAAATLADFLANPANITAAADISDPAVAHAVQRAVVAAFSDPAWVAALGDANRQALEAAREVRADGVVPATPWWQRAHAVINIESDAVRLPLVKSVQQSIDWQKYDEVERLFLLIQTGLVMRQAHKALTFLNDSIFGKLEAELEKIPGLEDLPVPQLQAALKGIAIAGATVEVAGVLIEGAIACTPGRIVDLYVRVDGQDRRPKDPPVALRVGQKAKLDVFMTSETYGGNLRTPFGLIEIAVEHLLKHKRVVAWFEKAKARAADAAAAGKLGEFVRQQSRAGMVAKLEAHFRANSATYGALGGKVWEYIKKTDPKWPIAPVKGAADINSDKVLRLRSNSPSLLRVSQTSEKAFFLEPLAATAPGKEAGYHAALKADLLKLLVGLPGTASPNVLGTVTIVKDEPMPKAQACYHNGMVIGVCVNGRCMLSSGDYATVPYICR